MLPSKGLSPGPGEGG